MQCTSDCLILLNVLVDKTPSYPGPVRVLFRCPAHRAENIHRRWDSCLQDNTVHPEPDCVGLWGSHELQPLILEGLENLGDHLSQEDQGIHAGLGFIYTHILKMGKKKNKTFGLDVRLTRLTGGSDVPLSATWSSKARRSLQAWISRFTCLAWVEEASKARFTDGPVLFLMGWNGHVCAPNDN